MGKPDAPEQKSFLYYLFPVWYVGRTQNTQRALVSSFLPRWKTEPRLWIMCQPDKEHPIEDAVSAMT